MFNVLAQTRYEPMLYGKPSVGSQIVQWQDTVQHRRSINRLYAANHARLLIGILTIYVKGMWVLIGFRVSNWKNYSNVSLVSLPRCFTNAGLINVRIMLD